MTASRLIELAERCEQASGPDRELDAAIGTALGLETQRPFSRPVPAYSASLGAAMSLVPEGYVWACGTDAGEPENQPWAWCDEPGELPDDYLRFAATPALALTAACLRALAQEEE